MIINVNFEIEISENQFDDFKHQINSQYGILYSSIDSLDDVKFILENPSDILHFVKLAIEDKIKNS